MAPWESAHFINIVLILLSIKVDIRHLIKNLISLFQIGQKNYQTSFHSDQGNMFCIKNLKKDDEWLNIVCFWPKNTFFDEKSSICAFCSYYLLYYSLIPFYIVPASSNFTTFPNDKIMSMFPRSIAAARTQVRHL